MLKPAEERLNYSDLLTPPTGYDVDFAVGTTYSLDLEALVGVPIALSLSEEMEGTFKENPIYVLEALRRSVDKFAIFCEAGQIKTPQNANNVFSLMENSVFEVALANEKSFHPKVWLIKYRNEEEEELYRFLVLTRNLTFDRSWDLAIGLEGKKNKRKTLKNRPISDFLRFLIPYSKDDEKNDQIQSLISDLDYVHFDPVDKHIPSFEFYPLGIDGYGKDETGIFENYHHLLIISPFLSNQTVSSLNRLSLKNASKTLITRRTELAKLDETVVDVFDIYALKDLVVEGEGAISGENEVNEMAQLQDIHAKLYARTKYNEHQIFIGSANCSERAFNGNVEFLLRLDYQKYGFRIQHLLNDLFGEDERDNPFEKIEILPEKGETDTILSDEMEKAIKQLCRASSKAYVNGEENNYSLKITFDEIPSNVEFSISPLLSKQSLLLANEIVFYDLGLLELGQFYTITAIKDGETLTRIIKIPTEGIPAERDNEVFRSIIKDKYTFLRYVAFLLSDDFILAAIEQLEMKRNGAGKWDTTMSDYPVLYENMLKAAARSPEKLQDVENIMNYIKDDEIIPEEFNRLYETFIGATKKVRK
ncbi:phospholipase D family protein [Fredinandcohnia sp. 179-A 10B2 NHS]|uniref:phospholipase D family protein n=1 Tax=Fredinandcohnia sp. 179-A 10B2 NHS TaxID=3235176 RepID=UPI0039A1FCAA